MEQLQRRNNHSNIFRINYCTLLELQYYDVTKNDAEFEYYVYHALKGIFNIALVISPDKKIQKRFKNGTMRPQDWDNAKGFDIKNLRMVKDKLAELKLELKDDEAFHINGYDNRRFKIYNRFLSKDERFTFCMSSFDDYLLIHRDWNHKGIYDRRVYDDSRSYFYRKEVYKNMKEERLPPEDFTYLTWGNYSKKREKERRLEIELWY